MLTGIDCQIFIKSCNWILVYDSGDIGPRKQWIWIDISVCLKSRMSLVCNLQGVSNACRSPSSVCHQQATNEDAGSVGRETFAIGWGLRFKSWNIKTLIADLVAFLSKFATSEDVEIVRHGTYLIRTDLCSSFHLTLTSPQCTEGGMKLTTV